MSTRANTPVAARNEGGDASEVDDAPAGVEVEGLGEVVVVRTNAWTSAE